VTEEQPPGNYIGVRFRTEKYAMSYFFARKPIEIFATPERGLPRKSRARRGRGFKWMGRRPFKAVDARFSRWPLHRLRGRHNPRSRTRTMLIHHERNFRKRHDIRNL